MPWILVVIVATTSGAKIGWQEFFDTQKACEDKIADLTAKAKADIATFEAAGVVMVPYFKVPVENIRCVRAVSK